MNTETLRIASSWSLRDHYSRNLAQNPYGPGMTGRSLCKTGGIYTDVYDDAALRGVYALYGVDQGPLDRPRKICKLCERIARRLVSQEREDGESR